VIVPELLIVNFGTPPVLAANKSPDPELSTTSPAKEVLPDREAMGVVPELPRTSRVARGEVFVVPIPTLPELARNSLETSPASPCPVVAVSKLSDPPLRILTVAAGLAPVGTMKDILLEIDAVGLPPAIFMKANLAEEVAVEPRSRSSVMFDGARDPSVLWKYPTAPLVAQVCPEIQNVPVALGRVNV